MSRVIVLLYDSLLPWHSFIYPHIFPLKAQCLCGLAGLKAFFLMFFGSTLNFIHPSADFNNLHECKRTVSIKNFFSGIKCFLKTYFLIQGFRSCMNPWSTGNAKHFLYCSSRTDLYGGIQRKGSLVAHCCQTTCQP